MKTFLKRYTMGTRCHCRCRKCGARQVKDKHPDDYILGPICRVCGRRNTIRIDRWMNTRWKYQKNCGCTGYWFTHRMGSKYCHYRNDGSLRHYGDPDFHDRQLERLNEEAHSQGDYDAQQEPEAAQLHGSRCAFA